MTAFERTQWIQQHSRVGVQHVKHQLSGCFSVHGKLMMNYCRRDSVQGLEIISRRPVTHGNWPHEGSLLSMVSLFPVPRVGCLSSEISEASPLSFVLSVQPLSRKLGHTDAGNARCSCVICHTELRHLSLSSMLFSKCLKE